jgi:DNA-binding NtrC family response regulator
VAASHRVLVDEIAAGRFREDLYYRLDVISIALPPLRDRGDDVIELARHLLARAARRLGRPGLELIDESIAAIRAHHWPGNVRELDNAIERAAILCDTGRITPELLALDDLVSPAAPAAPSAPPQGESLEDYFRRFVVDHQDEMSETELARRLGISRKALWERRARLAIPRRTR